LPMLNPQVEQEFEKAFDQAKRTLHILTIYLDTIQLLTCVAMLSF
jgi:hypothetical protein